jgi:hypothetical protein
LSHLLVILIPDLLTEWKVMCNEPLTSVDFWSFLSFLSHEINIKIWNELRKPSLHLNIKWILL